MEITEVHIRLLTGEGAGDKLRGFCSITLDDDYVIRDLKVIEGPGGLFVAMPSRKVAKRCGHGLCRAKNHLGARFCNACGSRLSPERAPQDQRGRLRLHVDIAHPINPRARQKIHDRVVEEFRREVKRSRREGYVFANQDDVDELNWGDGSMAGDEIPGKELEGGAS
ncbi:MAG: septation protein SpoVG family protein [Planctomycetes bacterium]|nr:septation protein SpoVG family protein [Planctomycetota bacterium]